MYKIIISLALLISILKNDYCGVNMSTDWEIKASLKYDALCFLNIMTGDSFYLNYYKQVYDKFNPVMNEDEKSAVLSIKKKIKDDNNMILSAWLCLYFSAVEDSTIDQMIKTLNDLSILKTNFSKSPYYSYDSWLLFESIRSDLIRSLGFLKRIKFKDYWTSEVRPLCENKINEVSSGLPKYDVIAEVEQILGSKLLSNTITVYMLYFSQPHGIKITGTRFLTDIAWPFQILIRTAVHEMMHPPYNYDSDEELRNLIDSFKNDVFLMDKVLNHNPSFGYNTLEGLFEEDCVQSMDQVICEKLGIHRDAKKRWKENDDGIHVLAAALYQIMKQENYNQKNEKFRDFLLRIVREGTLYPGNIKDFYDKFYN